MAHMEISSQMLSGGIWVVKVAGTLDVVSFDEFKDHLARIFMQANDSRVAVDLREVSHIASCGWSILISRRKALRAQGGDLSVFGLNEGPMRVYESMHIHGLLPAAKDAADAAGLMGYSKAA